MEPPTPSLKFNERELFYREPGQPHPVSLPVQRTTTPTLNLPSSSKKPISPVSQIINPQITQLGRDKLGVKIPTVKPGQMLPLETNFETLNAIRKARYKIETVNSGATFQPYNQ